ncbi:RNA polymerase sigma-70 factor [Olivibacter sitiensis]|uniref:RNA polymerase sigma-70 factor n=1 Tax=Olivibacter sitiensis TaxID=376470 RepID=UPI00047FFCED|nr:RNA polymerase sigma-70 factor [Olivibacter sitiensis]
MKNYYSERSEQLFKRYYPRLCHFAWQLTGGKTDVEDVVQDAFLVLWEKRSTISDSDIAIKNFLYTTVKNSCLNLYRRAKVVDRYLDRTPISEQEEPLIMEKIIRSEVLAEVCRIVDTMPHACQEVFRLGYLEGLNNAEVAERLGVSVNTIKTQKQRGLRILRTKLDPGFFLILLSLLQER